MLVAEIVPLTHTSPAIVTSPVILTLADAFRYSVFIVEAPKVATDTLAESDTDVTCPTAFTENWEKGPYEAAETPEGSKAKVGFPSVPSPLVMVTPVPAVIVLPLTSEPLTANIPVLEVISVIAFRADTSDVKVTPLIWNDPLTLTLELESCKAEAVPSPS
jgi:hypothetical protein